MARQLRALGFDAVALKGGYTAWKAAQAEVAETPRQDGAAPPTTTPKESA